MCIRARRDADGYFWIMGRIDDVLNVSGHRLGTMEAVSYTHLDVYKRQDQDRHGALVGPCQDREHHDLDALKEGRLVLSLYK